MADLRRSPSLESVSSVQSLASMQSAESVSSLVSTESLDERGAKPSDHENLNDIDMGRTITSIPIPAPSVSENGQGVDDPSSKIGNWANTCHDGLAPSLTTNPSSRPAVKPALLNTKKHNRFYMDPRTIQLMLDDGTLYRVFRQLFEEHSPAFTTQYLADCSEDEPIKLSGVSSVDLDRFLSLMYPSELATCELSTADEWISVLRLAHKWSFAALRTRAIREVKAIGTAVDRIASAREFSNLDELQEWLLPAFTETCTASDWLQTTTVDDAERLGAGTLLHIARMREDARQTTKKSSICAMERAIVAAGLAPEPSRETCAEPSALPAHVTLTKTPASAPLKIPSSPRIVPKPTTTLDAQGSGSASPPSAPVDTSSVKLAAPITLVAPVMTVEQAPTRSQKTDGSDTVAAAPRLASPAVVDQAESAKPASPVAPRPVVHNDQPRAPSATQPQRSPSAVAGPMTTAPSPATKGPLTPPSTAINAPKSWGSWTNALASGFLDGSSGDAPPQRRLTIQERMAAKAKLAQIPDGTAASLQSVPAGGTKGEPQTSAASVRPTSGPSPSAAAPRIPPHWPHTASSAACRPIDCAETSAAYSSPTVASASPYMDTLAVMSPDHRSTHNVQSRSAQAIAGPTSDAAANSAEGESQIGTATTLVTRPPAPAIAKPEVPTISAEQMARMWREEKEKLSREVKDKWDRRMKEYDERQEQKLEARVRERIDRENEVYSGWLAERCSL